MADQLLWNVGFTLFVVGLVFSFIALLWLVLSGIKGARGKVKGGGVFIIGPVPIIFGTDKESVKIILVLSIVLVVLLLVLMIFSRGIFG